MTNVHDVAIELEKILCKEFGVKPRPKNTIFGADFIETYMFYDDIALLLYHKGNGDYTEFLDSIYKYKGKAMNIIPNCKEIFEQFKLYLY